MKPRSCAAAGVGGTVRRTNCILSARLRTQFQLGVEPVGQAKSITLVGLHHPLWALLHMDTVDGYIQVQQVLFEVFVIVTGVLKQDRSLFDRHKFTDSVDESAEAFS